MVMALDSLRRSLEVVQQVQHGGDTGVSLEPMSDDSELTP
jgi:hypothetical protein